MPGGLRGQGGSAGPAGTRAQGEKVELGRATGPPEPMLLCHRGPPRPHHAAFTTRFHHHGYGSLGREGLHHPSLAPAAPRAFRRTFIGLDMTPPPLGCGVALGEERRRNSKWARNRNRNRTSHIKARAEGMGIKRVLITSVALPRIN